MRAGPLYKDLNPASQEAALRSGPSDSFIFGQVIVLCRIDLLRRVRLLPLDRSAECLIDRNALSVSKFCTNTCRIHEEVLFKVVWQYEVLGRLVPRQGDHTTVPAN